MCYSFACVLCQYGTLVIDFQDAWAEGDGERVMWCWGLFLSHFYTDGLHKRIASKHSR